MFGRNLKTLREKNNLTQKDLANSLAVSRQAVCMWERGERTPKVSVLAEVAKTFDVSLDNMINGNSTSQNSNSKEKEKVKVKQKPIVL